ncbi:PH, RCC1 and FYVE domains-containing protein 1-like [Andrographis paniculata]|uniref:PH, RCC1 and FYVE domains-containing protein 1-like n=1 Tax=Andrographis paniculata TaxID=175694 RepID=UPI0021E93051|nr:PH, RCC1 and FYVE domains-containing protein 1-like [Andrographis paniculata]
MADDIMQQRLSLLQRDIEQAITALKRGAHLLKYGRRGRPKFCPFRISSDESTLIWFDGRVEKLLELSCVSKLIPGQRTATFKRYPRPEKEYQSFSLICDNRSLDLICKDKDEAEVWFTGLKALIARNSGKKQRNESKSKQASSPGGHLGGVRRIPSSMSFFSPDRGDSLGSENSLRSRLGKVFAEVVSLTAPAKNAQLSELIPSLTSVESSSIQASGAEGSRVSHFSAMSSSSQSSCIENLDNLGDVYIWGERMGDGTMVGGPVTVDRSPNAKATNALLPKLMESTMVLDVQTIVCGWRHAVLVSKQGELFSWGDEGGGRLGHGIVADAPQPKLVEALNGKTIEAVACGAYHTCAVTTSGEAYTWGGGGSLNCGLIGHRSDASHWIPQRVCGPIEGLHVSFVACGPWHTAFLTSTGRLFTFGDGTFGVLGHGDRCCTSVPREVEALQGYRSTRVACGTWHTAALVEIPHGSSSPGNPKQTLAGKVFTWGDGDKGRLGHGSYESKLSPECVSALIDVDFSRVDCGDNFTVAVTTTGQVYTMGSTCSKSSDGKFQVPLCIDGNIADVFAEEISCGSHHVAILTSKGEVYTWGKGTHGQLGHGDYDDRSTPTPVAFFKDKQVKSIACGSNFMAAVCVHKGISSTDNSVCSGCHSPFTFLRKRHNCYNCGLVFCNSCSSRKSVKASLAPSRSKAYRVCDDCFTKLQRSADAASLPRIPSVKSEGLISRSPEERENGSISGIISRLSSAESFKSDKSSIFSMKFDSNEHQIFPLQDGCTHRRSTSSLSPGSPSGSLQNSHPTSKSVSLSPSPVPGKSPWRSTAASPASPSVQLFSSENVLPLVLPDAKSLSRSLSPVPRKSPWRSATLSPSSLPFFASEPTIDELKNSNYNLSLEVKSLRAQVEKLTSKSRHLETELERKFEQLKAATSQAAEEAEKNKAAKEVIKSLGTQLKEMAERMPYEQLTSSDMDVNERMITNSYPSNRYNATGTSSPNSVSSDSSTTSSLSNGTRAQAHKSEQTLQDEPGVYVTIVTLSNGVNELQRIRFSKKLFTESEAEEWWTENGAKICQRHNVKLHDSDS